MKKVVSFTAYFLLVILVAAVSFVFGKSYQKQGFILEHEKDIARSQPAPHNGTGMSTGYLFFSKVPDLSFSFRKRVLLPGSEMGYHLQQNDEVYYIQSGTGNMKMNGDSFAVKTGDAILTRTGSSHGIRQTGNDSLVIIITYPTR